MFVKVKSPVGNLTGTGFSFRGVKDDFRSFDEGPACVLLDNGTLIGVSETYPPVFGTKSSSGMLVLLLKGMCRRIRWFGGG